MHSARDNTIKSHGKNTTPSNKKQGKIPCLIMPYSKWGGVVLCFPSAGSLVLLHICFDVFEDMNENAKTKACYNFVKKEKKTWKCRNAIKNKC